jgi:hypothetical protein
MKSKKAKEKAVAAIGEIVRAAKELVKAEQAYYNRKPRKAIATMTKRGRQ